MQFPVEVEAMPVPELNKKNPHELHWRKEPPEWMGSLDAAYHNKYSRLAETSCCLQCGAVPCPYDHESEQRKRLQEMEFVRELVQRKAELEDQVKKLEEDLNDMKQLYEQKIFEQERMRMRLNYFERAQREWMEEKTLMESELRRLRQLNEQNMSDLKQFRKDRRQLEALKEELQKLQGQYSEATKERDSFKRMVLNLTTEVNGLKAENVKITAARDEAMKTVKVLRVELEESREAVSKVQKELHNSEEKNKKLNEAMAQLAEEISRMSSAFKVKEMEFEALAKSLRDLIQTLEAKLAASENTNKQLRNDIQSHLAEIERLKAKLASDKRFVQFVAVKREVNELKGENQELMQKVLHHEDSQPFPVMKKSGKVTTAGSRVKSAVCLRALMTTSTIGPGTLRPRSAIGLSIPRIDIS